MTPQEIFDKAVHGVIKQGHGSYRMGKGNLGSYAACRYRSEAGACAVGHLIDDETAELWDAQENPDIAAIIDPDEEEPDYEKLIDSVPDWALANAELLTELQKTHDEATLSARGMANEPTVFLTQFRSRAKQVAERFNLTFAEPEDVETDD